MGKKDFIALLVGLALFLYGMQAMNRGLENAAGNHMKTVLERFTKKRLTGVLAGAGITALVQSSSAVTVMVVGFVNSEMMTLRQAVWIIMGANIGTTITGQLIALRAEAIAPFVLFIGVVLTVFFKRPGAKGAGDILSGLGILFIGLEIMSTAMLPLCDSPVFLKMLTRFSNPVSGILAGALFTAVIQSSSASVGILQTLAKSGAVPFAKAVYVLFGQNIGTCITAAIASAGGSRKAKRTTVIHLLFNLTGTLLFTLLCLGTPLIAAVDAVSKGRPASAVANMHTLFNIATTILLLPAGNLLASAAEHILPDREEKRRDYGIYKRYFPGSGNRSR